MTFQITSDCGSIAISSDLFSTYLANPDDYTIKIDSKINCCDPTTTLEFDITDTNFDLANQTYTILPTFYDEDSSATSLSDGIYWFKVTLTTTATNSQSTDNGSTLVNCNLLCRVFDYIEDFPTATVDITRVWALYQALTYTEQCDDCLGNKGCTILDSLLDALDIVLDAPCGCS